MKIKYIFPVSLFVLSFFVFVGCSGGKSDEVKITESGLIEKVSKSSGLTRSQTQIGLSALMMLSEEILLPDEFTKLTKDLPGGDNLFEFASDLGFTPGAINTTADIVQILIDLGANPVDAGKFLTSVLSVTKSIEGGSFSLLSKVFEK
ncbi:MAG: DUF2780 domain-containing protein [Ignavibacteriae bacterium]|nr:DUF2780 domain-containing protein [Ignavibacteriota bacterium]